MACGTHFRKWHYWPNSIHAQRLLILLDRAGGGKMAALGFDLLQRMTFEEGINVSRFRVLCAVATQLGVPDPVAFLRSSQHQTDVLHQDSAARCRLGIEAGPFFRVFLTDRERKRVDSFSGARGPNRFLEAIEKMVLSDRAEGPLHPREADSDSDEGSEPASFPRTGRRTPTRPLREQGARLHPNPEAVADIVAVAVKNNAKCQAWAMKGGVPGVFDVGGGG
ncbi:hypothetical protein T484DRAFT_1773425 [Baffinella frigidus]|nr:hypothetical protein T484DRAFT_1773425 [Cryptophyta sp. CCMP2293]